MPKICEERLDDVEKEKKRFDIFSMMSSEEERGSFLTRIKEDSREDDEVTEDEEGGNLQVVSPFPSPGPSKLNFKEVNFFGNKKIQNGNFFKKEKAKEIERKSSSKIDKNDINFGEIKIKAEDKKLNCLKDPEPVEIDLEKKFRDVENKSFVDLRKIDIDRSTMNLDESKGHYSTDRQLKELRNYFSEDREKPILRKKKRMGVIIKPEKKKSPVMRILKNFNSLKFLMGMRNHKSAGFGEKKNYDKEEKKEKSRRKGKRKNLTVKKLLHTLKISSENIKSFRKGRTTSKTMRNKDVRKQSKRKKKIKKKKKNSGKL